MAGTVDIVHRAWTGLDVAKGRLRLDPSLPDEVTRLALQVRFRGASLGIEITPDTLRVACLDCGPTPVTVEVRGSVETLRVGAVCVFRYAASR